MAYETPLTIAEIVKGIYSNNYVLPSIQREFVWKTTQIEMLFDSLMQDYPIGAFLFWEISKENYSKYEFYHFLKDYHERDNTHNPKANISVNDNVIAVLDGQQRMTSLYIGLKGTYAYRTSHKRWNNSNSFPKRKLYLNLVSPSQESDCRFEFKFLTDDECQNGLDCYWFEVGKILDMTSLSAVQAYIINHIMQSYPPKKVEFATGTLSKFFQVVYMAPTISYYKEKTEELDKVLNIFIRVNSGGTVLSYSDLLLSIATAQWENLDARTEITELVDEINLIGRGFNFNKDFVLKASLILSDFPNIAFKADNFNKRNMNIIEEKWGVIKKSIYQAVSLVSSFGYSRETLRANNAVIPIAYYLMVIGNPDSFELSVKTVENRRKIQKWFVLSLLKKVFNNAPDGLHMLIRETIVRNGKNDFPLEQIIQYCKGTNKSISFTQDDIDEYLLKQKYGNREILAIFTLLYPSIDFSQKFHIDHIYPKSSFTKRKLLGRGIDNKDIPAYMDAVNDISNLQLLPAIPNIEKQNKDFAEWFEETNITDKDKQEYRHLHYIPDMEYTYENYLEFIEERKKLLRNKLTEILL